MTTADHGPSPDAGPQAPQPKRLSLRRLLVVFAVSVVVAMLLALGFWNKAMNDAFKDQNNNCPEGSRDPVCDDAAMGAAFFGAYAAAELMDRAKTQDQPYPSQAQLARAPSVQEKIGPWDGKVRVISADSKARTYCLEVSAVDTRGRHTFYIPTDEVLLAPDLAQHVASSPSPYPCK